MMLGSQRGHWESARIPFFPTTRRSTPVPLPRLVRMSSLCTRHCCYHGGASMCSGFPSAINTKAFWNAFKQKRYLVIPELFSCRFSELNDYTERHFIALKTKSSKLASSRTNHHAFWSIDKLVKASKDANSEIYHLASQMLMKQWRYIQLMVICGSLIGTLLVVSPANAVDALKTCTCLLKECRIELAKCISNPSCAANVACLQTCNNRPDETECQIKCGDLFENSVVDEFNECAVSRKKCVPRKLDVGEFPVPASSALVTNFNISDFSGKWYITSGLNPTFDTFDCQLHEFHVESDRLVGNLTWRIRTPDGGFFTRSATQMFKQDPLQPGILYNHDNEYLHYQDDWYILSSRIENKPDDYIFVYYRGRNDAWDGYGGAVVYTRSATLPENIVPELQGAAKSVGRDFNTFITTDNSCGPEPPLVERLEKTVEAGEETIIKEVEEIEGEVEKLEKTELTLLQRLAEGFQEVERDAENFLRGLSKDEMEVLRDLNMEAEQIEKVFGQALPIRKLR